MANVKEDNNATIVELASGVVKIEEKGGLLHVHIFVRANKGTEADANVTLTVVDRDAEQNLLSRSDAGMYSYNGKIIAIDKTHSPFKQTVIVDKKTVKEQEHRKTQVTEYMGRFVKEMDKAVKQHEETGQNPVPITCPECNGKNAKVKFFKPNGVMGGCSDCGFQVIS